MFGIVFLWFVPDAIPRVICTLTPFPSGGFGVQDSLPQSVAHLVLCLIGTDEGPPCRIWIQFEKSSPRWRLCLHCVYNLCDDFTSGRLRVGLRVAWDGRGDEIPKETVPS